MSKGPECLVVECARPKAARGYCDLHYYRFKTHGDPLTVKRVAKGPEACTLDGCGRKFYARGWCKTHYNYSMRHLDPSETGVASCSVNECLRAHYSRTYCRLHWERWKRHGDPSVTLTALGTPISDRIAARSVRVGPCQEWTALRDQDGYGQLTIAGKPVGAHRASWEEANGPIPAGMLVRHKCDNPPCVRLEHLELGTLADNSRDMVERGRSLYGEKNGSAKLKAGQVLLIYKARLSGRTLGSIAKEFGCGMSTVRRIVQRQSWSRLLDENFPEVGDESAY